MGKGSFSKKILPNFDLYLFCLAGLIVTIIFHYVPIYGVQIAFRDYSIRKGITGSTWVGLKHFIRFFNSPTSMQLILNTIILSVYSLIASFPIPIILALMLNSFRHKRYRKVIQSVTYAPNFISVIVMCGMLMLYLSPRVGIVNTLLGFIGVSPINFMAEQSMWRHIYVWSGIWQTMGWSSVIYFAALSGVSPEYHEAAVVDGASKFKRIIHIDLPAIIPVASMLLILSIGSIFSLGFDKAFALQNDMNREISEIIPTYVYRVGLINNDVSFSAAIGLFNSAVNAILLFSANYITGKFSENSIF